MFYHMDAQCMDTWDSPDQWVFYIISVLSHIHIFTDVSIFGCFVTLYRNLGMYQIISML